jgi:hypothetical protein
MDALVLILAKKLPVSAIAQMFGVSENRIWRAINGKHPTVPPVTS